MFIIYVGQPDGTVSFVFSLHNHHKQTFSFFLIFHHLVNVKFLWWDLSVIWFVSYVQAHPTTFFICSCFFSLDIDECKTFDGSCSHSCSNVVGTYTCTCPTGFVLDDNGLDCLGNWKQMQRSYNINLYDLNNFNWTC